MGVHLVFNKVVMVVVGFFDVVKAVEANTDKSISTELDDKYAITMTSCDNAVDLLVVVVVDDDDDGGSDGSDGGCGVSMKKRSKKFSNQT
jgi:hypothetical protein